MKINKNTPHYKVLETDANLTLMSKVLSIHEITAQVMANRGIRSKNTALSFLYPASATMHDTMQMKDADLALWHINDAIDRGLTITVYGDYDVDGVTGTVIVYKTLRYFNADVNYYIPHRAEEGYGLNLQAVRHMAAQGTGLIITVDNGISALEEIAEANALGMHVVVIDHHEPGAVLPPASAIADPKQKDCPYPFKSLCAGGLAFKLMEALYKKREVPFQERDELLALAAVATLCDIVDLSGENRIMVKLGLEILNANKYINPGLGSLIMQRGYLDKPIDAFSVGYILGPCINATGRLSHAKLAVDLFLTGIDENEKRIILAQKLSELNDKRKNLTAEATARAITFVESCAELDKVLVLVDKDMHESVAGIVAGRVRDAVNRPCLILTCGESDMKGSGRSIEHFDLFSALSEHKHLFKKFGGHEMAAGLSLTEENIPLLRESLNRGCVLTDDDFREVIAIDRVLQPEDITLALSEELARLAPFGKGNPEPQFITYGLTIENVRRIDEKNTLIFTFLAKNGYRLKGIAFGLNERYDESITVIDAAYTVETNVYNGVKSVQMRIRDLIYP